MKFIYVSRCEHCLNDFVATKVYYIYYDDTLSDSDAAISAIPVFGWIHVAVKAGISYGSFSAVKIIYRCTECGLEAYVTYTDDKNRRGRNEGYYKWPKSKNKYIKRSFENYLSNYPYEWVNNYLSNRTYFSENTVENLIREMSYRRQREEIERERQRKENEKREREERERQKALQNRNINTYYINFMPKDSNFRIILNPSQSGILNFRENFRPKRLKSLGSKNIIRVCEDNSDDSI